MKKGEMDLCHRKAGMTKGGDGSSYLPTGMRTGRKGNR
jgi:hypothetical protein